MDSTNDAIGSAIKVIKEKINENVDLTFIETIDLTKKGLLKSTNETEVYAGIYQDKHISIKGFSTMKILNTYIHPFLQEIRTSLQTTHPKVPKFYGVNFNKTVTNLIYDQIKGQSIKKKSIDIKLKDKLNLIIQLVKIINDLHLKEITHKGLRTSKFIVDDTNIVFLKDFGETNYEKGTSPKIYEDEEKNNFCVYNPPEYFTPSNEEEDFEEDVSEEKLKKDQELNEKFDMWSLACIISEIYSGKVPWSNMPSKKSKNKAITFLLEKREFPIPEELDEELKELLRSCLKINAEERILCKEFMEK